VKNIATFFIVDDDGIIHFFYRSILEKLGHKVLAQAYNGMDCIEIFRDLTKHKDTCPDYVIMDYKMPIKNGLETMRELLRLDPGLIILFISGDTSIKEKAIENGATGFFEKPIGKDRLVQIINEYCSNTTK
jgi:CheY-like chemotaxis protein